MNNNEKTIDRLKREAVTALATMAVILLGAAFYALVLT